MVRKCLMLKFFLLVITDFEDSMVVAVQKVFPETHLSGCYFRFAQELFKKWAECNLGNIYGDDKSQTGNIARMTFRFFKNFLIRVVTRRPLGKTLIMSNFIIDFCGVVG